MTNVIGGRDTVQVVRPSCALHAKTLEELMQTRDISIIQRLLVIVHRSVTPGGGRASTDNRDTLGFLCEGVHELCGCVFPGSVICCNGTALQDIIAANDGNHSLETCREMRRKLLEPRAITTGA